ncbi:MAG TPA: DNA polymerase III subunit beta [Thermomicrobiales bacterium]|nr:DNA polymerase III subunit beta [Thermomicrobiales bacterium]
MDLCVAQADLARALRLVARAAPARPPTPALGHVLLDATPGRLTLTCTDSTLGLMAAVAADVARPGRAALPARLLEDYAAQLPAGMLRLTGEPDRGRVRAGCGRATASLATTDAAAFPAPPAPDMATARDIDAPALRRALARVLPAAARDDTRPVLGAVLLALDEAGSALAAADGFRLARARLPGLPGTPRELLVPARAAAEAARLLAAAETARLVVLHAGRGLWLVAGAAGLYTRLVQGRFPDTAALVPATWRTRVTVARAALRAALQQAALFGADPMGARAVVLVAAPGCLGVAAAEAATGEVRSDLPAELAGAPGAIALDAHLLLDLLAGAEAPRLTLSWSGPAGALVVREADAADGDLWLLMPLHDPALLAHRIAVATPARADTAVAA